MLFQLWLVIKIKTNENSFLRWWYTCNGGLSGRTVTVDSYANSKKVPNWTIHAQLPDLMITSLAVPTNVFHLNRLPAFLLTLAKSKNDNNGFEFKIRDYKWVKLRVTSQNCYWHSSIILTPVCSILVSWLCVSMRRTVLVTTTDVLITRVSHHQRLVTTCYQVIETLTQVHCSITNTILVIGFQSPKCHEATYIVFELKLFSGLYHAGCNLLYTMEKGSDYRVTTKTMNIKKRTNQIQDE